MSFGSMPMVQHGVDSAAAGLPVRDWLAGSPGREGVPRGIRTRVIAVKGRRSRYWPCLVRCVGRALSRYITLEVCKCRDMLPGGLVEMLEEISRGWWTIPGSVVAFWLTRLGRDAWWRKLLAFLSWYFGISCVVGPAPESCVSSRGGEGSGPRVRQSVGAFRGAQFGFRRPHIVPARRGRFGTIFVFDDLNARQAALFRLSRPAWPEATPAAQVPTR
jgi:hypothetical protein